MSAIQLMTIREVRLHHCLTSRGITEKNVKNALEEYAFVSMGEGKRVREWCEEITNVLEKISAPAHYRDVLDISPLKVLLPFIHLPSNPYFPTAQPPLPSPLVSVSCFPSISRHQFIDALSRFSQQDHAEDAFHIDDEALIVELCLEYIARRWRIASSEENQGEDTLVDGISRKLTEIEFELQLEANSSTLQSDILPILHRVRFNLGFVTSSQLITKLNNGFTNTSIEHGRVQAYQPFQIVKAWIERRLCAGVAYQIILDDLKAVRNRAENEEHKHIIIDVLADIGILQRSQDEERYDQFGFDLSPSPLITSPIGSKRTRTLSALFQSQKMGRKSSHQGMTSTKWFSHKRNMSNASKTHLVNPDQRRPSLSTMSTMSVNSAAAPQSPTLVGTPMSATFPDYINNRCSSSTIRLATSLHDDVFASLMAFTDPEDVRAVLLNHLMEMRYHVHGQEEEGWFLCGGKDRAEDLLNHLERKMVGKKDVMGLREVFTSMRAAFDLTPLTTSMVRRPSNVPTSPTSLEFPAHGRGVSFDIDQYLAEIAPPIRSADIVEEDVEQEEMLSAPTRESVGAQSILTTASHATSDSQCHAGRRASRLSDFTIREAKVEYPLESKAVEYHLSKSPVNPDNDPMTPSLATGYKKIFSQSVPNLSDSPYIRLPAAVSSLRRHKLHLTKSKTPARLNSPRDRSSTPKKFAHLQEVTLTPNTSVLHSAVTGNTSQPLSNCIRETLCTLSSSSTLSSPSDHLLVTPRARRESSDTDKNRRQLHRNFVIFDGEQVSPSRELLHIHGDTEDDERRTPTEDTGNDKENLSPSALLSTPRLPPRISSLKVPARVRFSPSPAGSSHGSNGWSSVGSPATIVKQEPVSAVPLEIVIQLYNTASFTDGISPDNLELVLRRLVETERSRGKRSGQDWDAHSKSHVVWLIEQLAILLKDAALTPTIDRVISSLSSTSQDILDEPLPIVTIPTRSFLSPKHVQSNPNSSASSPCREDFASHKPLNLLQRRSRSKTLQASISSFDSVSSTYSTPSVQDSDCVEQKRLGLFGLRADGRDSETCSIGTFGRKSSVEDVVLAI
ncbi:hypothetical protein IAR55_004104 [Kwoniella newhampshirensis]|uniref:Uncharacterized protein n=1 Tax=Kwoniella newhampshirensis TaxID=1651941 RepID=A0AAW0YMN4_9TREE